jgi:hypothetical protein
LLVNELTPVPPEFTASTVLNEREFATIVTLTVELAIKDTAVELVVNPPEFR